MKMLFFDVDGTLTNDKTHTIPNSTILALKQLKEKGYKLFIATGRSFDLVKDMGIQEIIHWDGFICNNGQTILDGNAKILQVFYLPEESVQKMIEIANKNKEPLYFNYGDSIAVVGEIDENMIAAHKYFQSPLPTKQAHKSDGVIMALAYRNNGDDYKEYANLPGIDLFRGVGTWADIVKSGITKQTGIQFFLDLYNQKNYIAFGDSQNDVEMLKNATIGVAMGSGTQEAKDVASYITGAVSEDGLYNACKHYNLI